MPEPWCEMSMIPFDARAANDGDFSSPFIQIEYTLLVPSGSLIRSVADADRTGVNIAVVRNHASTVTLSRTLKQAKLVYAETPDPIFDLQRTGQADAMASARSTLLEYSAQLPGSRVLEDHYGANVNRVVIPKGNVGRLAYVNEFVEEAKASGLVQKASIAAARAGFRWPRREIPPPSSECVMGEKPGFSQGPRH